MNHNSTEKNVLELRLQELRNETTTSKKKKTELLKYTSNNIENPNGQSNTKIIRLAEKKVDPLMPRGFKVKAPKPRSGSPPPPILHSPPRKLTSQEAAKWSIPPCVSSWKNPKGYVIPLDKRLATDGRGLQQPEISDNFAKLTESLYVAERHAREEVKLRAEMQTRLAEQERLDKERKLREIAQRARAARERQRSRSPEDSRSESDSNSDSDHMTPAERRAYRERQQLRKQRERQRQRDMRLTKMGSETRAKVMQKLQGREISEQIALGVGGGRAGGEVLYDQRLFDRSEGLASGFTAEDAYSLYDKPLFNANVANAIYRPQNEQNMGADYEKSGAGPSSLRHAAGLGFQSEKSGEKSGYNFGPVEFEKRK